MIFKGLLEDARSIRDRDPAARTTLEVVLLYQGFHALFYHRQAHWLYKHKHFFLARALSQFARHMTGIEIHPGARSANACLLTTAWASLSVKPPRLVMTARFTTV